MAFLGHRKPQLDDEDNENDNSPTPLRYASLDRVYSASCVTGAMSTKKVKAHKLSIDEPDRDHPKQLSPAASAAPPTKPAIVRVYSRNKRRRLSESFFDTILAECGEYKDSNKRRRLGNSELVKLGVDSSAVSCSVERPRRDARNHTIMNPLTRRRRNSSISSSAKKWLRLSYNDIDPKTLIGLKCKVYWPLDANWYSGHVIEYDAESNRHNVKYQDGDKEELILANEDVKFHISGDEMNRLKISPSADNMDNYSPDFDEMVVLAASLDDCQEPEPGEIIWAKLTGHAMWPAVVVDEALVGGHKGLNKTSGGKSVPVQFFGTHDFARITVKHVFSFLKGLLSYFHLKCKKPHFNRSLEEAKAYLSEQKLPRRMIQLQNGIGVVHSENSCSENDEAADEDCINEKWIQGSPESSAQASPLVLGDLQIISLGRIVKDSEYFQDDRSIWPEGYTAIRKFTSITDPNGYSSYKMEVLRDAQSKIRPLFRVTLDNADQFEGSTPSACWNKIFRKLKKIQHISSDTFSVEGGLEKIYGSGSDMFGFSNPEVAKLLQGLKSRLASKSSMSKVSGRHRDVPVGYRPVRVDWKDLDKCNVCHMDEEYENNLFLQCDKCRMMVHARCYGELGHVDGELWLCNLCRPGAPESRPPCCLCPVVGGAMKPTADGRWAHLTCAIWIPETCLSDIKKMEPIDGLNRVSKDRWKLLCSICGVAYGACIQCSNHTCRVAYHPLCARAAGLCVELEDEDRLQLLSLEEDEDDQCIRLLSYCKKHRQPTNERLTLDERLGQNICCSDYTPPVNASGCARTEPYNHFGRRGRKEPEALAAASLKRLFVENQPYIVAGYCQHGLSGSALPSIGIIGSKFSFSVLKDSSNGILSMVDKYKYMRETVTKRLAFGKSGIHGFGIFAKQPHRAGDMVIEYTGELVRPSIADRREHFIYNSLVGAGTYMFRIHDERVIDATRAGSIAHLINHSCEPNCYSRLITVDGDEHIIIFAKRDIKQWEELTYDYRFFSIDERLPCYCGYPRCRGIVNETEEERTGKLYVPRSELTDWTED